MLEAQEAMNAMLKDRRSNLEQAFETAAKGIKMQTCRKELSAGLLSRSLGKTAMDRLKAQRTPRHQTGLTRTPSPALNSATQVHELRQSGRGIRATDGGALHRSTYMRRRDRTLLVLNEFVAIAGRVHLPTVECPPESDTKAHNDYKAKVSACACKCALVLASCRGGSAGDPRERRQLLQGRDAAYPLGDHRQHRPLHLGLRCRTRRKSTYAKIMAAVMLRATGGTIRGLAAFRRLERKSSGIVSGVASVAEAGEGSEIVWEHVKGYLDIYITQPEAGSGQDP